jgi:hypothetical protein
VAPHLQFATVMLTPLKSVRYLTVLLLSSLAIASCDPEPPIDNRPMPTLDLAQCTRTWQTLVTPAESPSSAKGVQLKGDRLFFAQRLSRESGIVSVPTTGGTPTTVRNEEQLRFWIEGEQLLFVNSGGLFRAPLAGGAAERVLGGSHFDRDNPKYGSGWALDRDSLFWAEHLPPNGPEKMVTIWRGLRNGGGETALGTLTSSSLIDEILPIGDQLVVTANGRGNIWTVPRTGGTPQPLAWLTSGVVTRLHGILDDGRILFDRPEFTDESHLSVARYVVGHARIDGTGAETILTTPRPIVPAGVWSDGAGGWYVSTTETAMDLTLHTAIWSVDSAGKGIRLACDPKESSTIESAVATRAGIYLLVEQNGGGTPTSPPPPHSWQLVTVKTPVRSL